MIRKIIDTIQQYAVIAGFESNIVLMHFAIDTQIDILGPVPLYLRLCLGLVVEIDIWIMIVKESAVIRETKS